MSHSREWGLGFHLLEVATEIAGSWTQNSGLKSKIMNKLLLAFLPTLLVSTVAVVPAVKAQDAMQMPSVEVRMRLTLTPFNLAYLAHQGYFAGQGIPDSSDLMKGFNDGTITAAQVVQAAVNDKRLPVAFLKNDSYIAAVKNQLYTLTLSAR
ncbi:MAG: hypothetical protein DCE90_05190 [Pseudanabaena sp.]|nr:MAG: hypothetical protein DCE90_05190 [Pseudanabaena sp.]